MAEPIIDVKTSGPKASIAFLGLVCAVMPTGALGSPIALVPVSSSLDRCLVEETIAAELDAAGIPVIRAPVPDDEPLTAALARTGADAAFSGRAELDADGRLSGGLVLSLKGAAPVRAKGSDLGAMLRGLWPSALGALSPVAVSAAPSEDALAALCKGDPTRAYALAGSALALGLSQSAPPRGVGEQPLAIDIESGLALERSKKGAEAVVLLSRALERLKAGELPVAWRSPPPAGLPTSKVALIRGLVIGFTGGRFTALDPATGFRRWSVDVGRADPLLADADQGLLVALEDEAVTAVDLTTGSVRFRVPARRPFAEIASFPDRIVYATETEIVAVDRRTGYVLFRTDAPVELSAGPIRVKEELAIPGETEVLVLDPSTGAIRERLDLGDEISAPLFQLDARVYVVVGADRVGRMAPFRGIGGDRKPAPREAGRLDRLATELFAVRWPPTAAKSGIALAYADKKRGAGLALLEGEGTGPAKVLAKNVIDPVALDGGGFGVLEKKRDALVILDADGKQKQRVLLGGSAKALVARPGEILAAVGPRVFGIAPATGKRVLLAHVGEPIRDLAATSSLAVALGESGAIYGIARRSHPVVATAEARARVALARALTAQGRLPEADAALQPLPPRVDATVARAELAARREGARSAASLLGLLALPPLMPEARALADKAKAAIGLLHLRTMPADVSSLSSEHEWVAAELPGFGAVGLDRELGISWQHRGTRTASSALGPIVDGALLDPKSGQPRPEPPLKDRALELAARAWPKGPLGPLLCAACAGPVCAVTQGKSVALINPEGAARLMPAPAASAIRTLAISSDARFLVAILDEGAVDALDLKTGRWRGRIGLGATAVTISSSEVVIARGPMIMSFDVARGLGLFP